MRVLKNKILSILSIIFGLALISGVFGNACSGGFNSSYSESSLNVQALNNGDLVAIEGKATVSTAYSKQFLDNMLSCTGVLNPSTDTLLEYENRKGSVSEYGYATKITAPMLMAFVSIAGEVCSDLVDLESGSTSRMIFKDIDFNSESIFSEQVSQSVNRLARSCWQRNETDEELSYIINDVFSEGSVTPRDAAVMMCTSMLASVSAYEM
ncbi:MAG: hypothetical protein HOO06_10055 [Bdellovibrionaceae bacterium]|jgi:hypothetical protein|nr:hypothetical protein [Pseudobdellovibrionaceae bacterium]